MQLNTAIKGLITGAVWSLLITIRDFNGFLNHIKWFKWTTAKTITSRLRSSLRSMFYCYPLKIKFNSASAVHVYNLRTAETASW